MSKFFFTFTNGELLIHNENSHYCSLDLIYSPTISDYFVSYDPHPIAMFITFVREKSKDVSISHKITGFIYRDYDGDKREGFVFKKL